MPSRKPNLHEIDVIIDDEFREALSEYRWSMHHGYYRTFFWMQEVQKYSSLSMHRLVWSMAHPGKPVPKMLDHINRNRIDNRIENLRPASPTLNALNSGAGGVCWDRGAWCGSIRHRNASRIVGRFDEKQEALDAVSKARLLLVEYEEALLRGESPDYPDVRMKGPRLSDDTLLRLCAWGRTLSQAAEETGYTSAAIRYRAKKLGIKFRAGKVGRPATRTGGG